MRLQYLSVSGACPAVLDAPSTVLSPKLDHVWIQYPHEIAFDDFSSI